MDTLGSTASAEGESPRGGGPLAALCVALDADRPRDLGVRHILCAEIEKVVFGRGAERSAARAPSADGAVLALRFADARVSSEHAHLERRGRAWFLVDLGSKNGSRVNGEDVERVQLTDGDIVELGATFLVFRELPEALSSGIAEDSGGTLPIPTLNASFEVAVRRLARMARSKVSIIVRGETGTGKEVVARAVHETSGRAGPFAAINCGALPQTLVEAELFGFKKGAFSGATTDREGLVRSAHGGTLLLDEIGDLPLPSQAALLRVLQENEILPIGSTQPVPVDVRVIAATHRDLAALVASGSFREDLHARLSGFELYVPALADRIEDLGILIGALLIRLVPDRAGKVVFTRRSARALFGYGWPKNVRELEKCLEAALVLAGDRPIDLEHLPETLREAPSALPSRAPEKAGPDAPEDEERRGLLVRLLQTHRGSVSAVARDLGKARFQVQRWVKRYALRPDDYR